MSDPTRPPHEDGAAAGPRTLAIDVGGTGLKASVLDAAGQMTVKRVRVETPYPCTPRILVTALAKLVAPLPAYDRHSIGLPGVVRDGLIVTAPHFQDGKWPNYPLENDLAQRLGKPARLLNDAEVQGLGIIQGKGLEVVLTLGTGLGSAVFSNGALTPHIELAHHPIHKQMTYNDYVGDRARRKMGRKKWNKRVLATIEIVRSLLHYDTLYIGGGNAASVDGKLPANVHLCSNDAGLTGGVALWNDRVWNAIDRRDR